jgi:hypothetical protein
MNRADVIEYAIEFAWTLGDNIDISRAESRHKVLEKILDFLEENKRIPREDIDEYIVAYINRKQAGYRYYLP